MQEDAREAILALQAEIKQCDTSLRKQQRLLKQRMEKARKELTRQQVRTVDRAQSRNMTVLLLLLWLLLCSLGAGAASFARVFASERT